MEPPTGSGYIYTSTPNSTRDDDESESTDSAYASKNYSPVSSSEPMDFPVDDFTEDDCSPEENVTDPDVVHRLQTKTEDCSIDAQIESNDGRSFGAGMKWLMCAILMCCAVMLFAWRFPVTGCDGRSFKSAVSRFPVLKTSFEGNAPF